METVETGVLILGGGVAGLAAASVIGDRAMVLEKEIRPGGLVRTECFSGYWFDRVLHLLHLDCEPTFQRLQAMMQGCLARCPPVAYVETSAGTVRFPFQLNLAGLNLETKVACVADFVARASSSECPANYEQMLLETFGRAMCETFFFPYNRKTWRRPLNELASNGFHWNIAAPTLEQLLVGAFDELAEPTVYNSNGWYPRPASGNSHRGMELLSISLANQVSDLRLQHEVVEIDVESKTVVAQTSGERVCIRYEHCISTLPLPLTIRLCNKRSVELLTKLAELPHNSVVSAAFCIEGPRPASRGLWRYYASDRVSFTRLIMMHEFDPDLAPSTGWGLMAEIPCLPSCVPNGPEEFLGKIRSELHHVGAIPNDCKIIGEHLMTSAMAYVVFTPNNLPVVKEALSFLREAGIEPLGRYGRWEYSSMAQVIRDGFEVGESVRSRL